MVVVGAGCVGSSVARELSKFALKVLVLEKADDVTQGATKGNSGIVHAGYDDEPGLLEESLGWLLLWTTTSQRTRDCARAQRKHLVLEAVCRFETKGLRPTVKALFDDAAMLLRFLSLTRAPTPMTCLLRSQGLCGHAFAQLATECFPPWTKISNLGSSATDHW